MFKLTTCCLLLVVLVAAAEANKKVRPCAGRCSYKDLAGRGTVCARNAKTNICTRLQACQLRERNCALRELGKAPLRQTSSSSCARVVGKSGSAPCASIRRRRTSKRRSCRSNPSCRRQRPNSCWRTRDGRNLWLSACSAQQRNCVNRRRPHLQLTRTNDWVCRDPKDKEILLNKL
ncbi:uncharacterized protein LOC117793719 [Drosophila innubila]|uniref:uncharacterized protein LOC117793719 n=1 Tax=Drosophila innubila TaxID=198719 RepID=UPI00148E6C23|nr:uncharacterized protein LOC117793719 [Drosophila innubila]